MPGLVTGTRCRKGQRRRTLKIQTHFFQQLFLPSVRVIAGALGLAWVDLPAAAHVIYIARFGKEEKRYGAAGFGIPDMEAVGQY